jgi:hypothetical protein
MNKYREYGGYEAGETYYNGRHFALASVTAERAEKRYQEEKAKLAKAAASVEDSQKEEQSLKLLILC